MNLLDTFITLFALILAWVVSNLEMKILIILLYVIIIFMINT